MSNNNGHSKRKHCLILAGGEWNQEFASCYMRERYPAGRPDLLIVADRGLEWAQAMGLRPDILLGDYDSVSSDILDQYRGDTGIVNMQYPAEKDYTDSHLAVMAAIEQRATDICILGGMGRRMDHALANLGLLYLCLQAGIPAELVDVNNRIRLVQDNITLKKSEQFGTYVSLLPYTEQVIGVTLTGFQYPLQEATLSLGYSIGVSNVIQEETATIRMRAGALFVIESKD